MLAPAALPRLDDLAHSTSPAPVDVPDAVGPPVPAHRETLPVGLLADIAAGIAEAPEAWRHLVRHDPHGRQPVRLLATDADEVWVIGWAPGQGVRPHDHGGSSAAVVVTDGELLEVDLLGARRRLEPGDVLRLGPGIVHDVVNHSGSPSTSIHVYSPPLSAMTYYDPETWQPEETVHVEHETPALDGWYGANLLHPTRARS
jgi:quercetin dioxygenase-like cupin family protein